MSEIEEVSPVRRPTSRDVALRAGVSQSVVSYVLTGSKPVSPQTRARVEAAIRDLAFRPSRLARSLRTTRSGAIGLIVPYITNAIYGSFVRAALETLGAEGYVSVIISALDARDRLDAYYGMLADGQLEGAIVFPYPDQVPAILELQRRGIALVLADRRTGTPEEDEIDAVLVDNSAGARAAVSHLVSLGHRRIALTTTSEATYGDSRVAGYRGAVAEHGIAFDERLIARGEGGIRAGHELTERLLRLTDPPTAIIATTDMHTLGSLEAIRAAGLQQGTDLGFVGYDADSAVTRLPASVPTIRYPASRLGLAAADILLHRLAHGNTTPVSSVTLEPELRLA